MCVRPRRAHEPRCWRGALRQHQPYSERPVSLSSGARPPSPRAAPPPSPLLPSPSTLPPPCLHHGSSRPLCPWLQALPTLSPLAVESGQLGMGWRGGQEGISSGARRAQPWRRCPGFIVRHQVWLSWAPSNSAPRAFSLVEETLQVTPQ